MMCEVTAKSSRNSEGDGNDTQLARELLVEFEHLLRAPANHLRVRTTPCERVPTFLKSPAGGGAWESLRPGSLP
jgi:hypothetical protein